MSIQTPVRRRVRVDTMAAELEISVRKMRELHTHGLPFTQFEGIIWYEPEKVHKWLDQFARTGAPGVKRTRGLRLKDRLNETKQARPNNKEVGAKLELANP